MASWNGSVGDVTLPRLVTLLILVAYFPFCCDTKPTFDNGPYSATLYELETATTTLATIECSNPNTDPVSVDLATTGAVTPSSPCGNCFSVLQCAPNYCLMFNPGGGTLNSKITDQYDIALECTDGNSVETAIVDLRLIRNSPPVFTNTDFTVTVSGTKKKTAGYQIYTVSSSDVDNDPITYTMWTDPASPNFKIGTGNGRIEAANDLILECRNYITFWVNISDGFNDPVGPRAIQATLESPNESPHLTNLDVSLQVPEDTAVGGAIRVITATDDTNVNLLTYTLSADPSENLQYFEIANGELRAKSTLNYETTSSRTTNLTMQATDGYCSSELRYVHVTITDANEPPDLRPKDLAYAVYEGSDFGPPFTINWNIIDEDFTDTHTYTIVGGNDDYQFSIDPDTGQLSVNGNYDIDNNNPTTRTLDVQVSDKGLLTSTTTVTLIFQDRNDNYPLITPGDFDYNVCETRRLGADLGTMTCTDDDITSPNNATYFTGGGSGITVLPSGVIIMATRPALGQTFTTTASCVDLGTYPGPLTSLSPVSISITGVECPTTVAPTTTPAPTTTAAATTTTITTTILPTDNELDWIDENLWWIVLAALLATALLGLLAYMWYIYCSRYCARCFSRPCCERQPPRPRKVPKPRTPPRAITPVETPREPPPAIVGNPNGNLFNFWQEKYFDDDYEQHPNRESRPRPITPSNVLPAGNGNGNGNGSVNGNEYGPEKSGSLDVGKEKKSRCVIL